MIKETVPLGHTGHLLHKTTLVKVEDIAILSNVEEKDSQNGNARKYAPNEGTG